jgi:hypothetical protein
MNTSRNFFLSLLATILPLAARVDPLLPPLDYATRSARPVLTLHLNHPAVFDAAATRCPLA